MRALAILCASISVLAATPSSAFVHMGGMHSAGPHTGVGPHGDHRSHAQGFVSGDLGPEITPDAPQAEPVNAPYVIPAPVPLCPAFVPAPPRHSGPHIIYIGHVPNVHGPRVIYGTE